MVQLFPFGNETPGRQFLVKNWMKEGSFSNKVIRREGISGIESYNWNAKITVYEKRMGMETSRGLVDGGL